MAAISLLLDTNMAAVTTCANTLYNWAHSWVRGSFLGKYAYFWVSGLIHAVVKIHPWINWLILRQLGPSLGKWVHSCCRFCPGLVCIPLDEWGNPWLYEPSSLGKWAHSWIIISKVNSSQFNLVVTFLNKLAYLWVSNFIPEQAGSFVCKWAHPCYAGEFISSTPIMC